MIYVTRRERFSSAHRLFRPDWDDQKNAAVFGACSNPNWHGHNYELFVTVKGELNPQTGFVVNLKDLGRLIREKIIDKTDHKNLNTEVSFLAGQIISTENIAVAIWGELFDNVRIMGCELHCVRVVETENNYVEYFGE